LLTSQLEPTNDAETISVDPTDARFIYAPWTQSDVKNRSWIQFARSTNGGQTWESPRMIVQSQPGNFVSDAQVFVLPSGSLVMPDQLVIQQQNKPVSQYSIQSLRSSDKGQTWSAPTPAFVTTPLLQPNTSGQSLIVDPETAQTVNDSFSPLYALDPRKGNLYIVWEDGRFSNFQNNNNEKEVMENKFDELMKRLAHAGRAARRVLAPWRGRTSGSSVQTLPGFAWGQQRDSPSNGGGEVSSVAVTSTRSEVCRATSRKGRSSMSGGILSAQGSGATVSWFLNLARKASRRAGDMAKRARATTRQLARRSSTKRARVLLLLARRSDSDDNPLYYSLNVATHINYGKPFRNSYEPLTL
jgi:hypothetical protein